MPTQPRRIGKKRPKKQLKPQYASAKYKGMYNWQWRKSSKQFLQDNPLCVCDQCKKLVVAKPATVTDHIIPHKGDEKLFWDQSNWQAMNKKCHDTKTATEDGGFGR